LVDADGGATLARSAPGPATTELAWSADGRRLLALSPSSVRLLDGSARLRRSIGMPPGERAESAAFAPGGGGAFALVRLTAGGGEVGLVSGDGGTWRLFAGAGRVGGVAWSPDGDWLLVTLPDADQWVIVRSGAGRSPKLLTVSSISRQFDPGRRGHSPFPAIRGWCCAAR